MTIFWSKIGNLVPRALFPGFGGGTPHLQSQEKRPGDEVVKYGQDLEYLVARPHHEFPGIPPGSSP